MPLKVSNHKIFDREDGNTGSQIWFFDDIINYIEKNSVHFCGDKLQSLKINCRDKRMVPVLEFETEVVVVALAAKKTAIRFWKKQFGDKNVRIILTTKRDIGRLMRHLFLSTETHNSSNLFHERRPSRSAKIIGWRDNLKILLLVTGLASGLTITAITQNEQIAIIGLTSIFFASLAFKIGLLMAGMAGKPEAEFANTRSWPAYSILVPLYKETAVLRQLMNALSNLDYPVSKLDIKLIFEEDDTKTLDAAKALGFPDFFDFIIVPNSTPKTKPKACNYALNYCKGDYVVIYDAEDRPEPDQLKKVVRAFEAMPENVACLQASLNFFNRESGWLVNCFALEYLLWFKFLLPGLQSLNVPLPLGGTSNHFVRRHLFGVVAWDAFNVTEDAEIGVRLYENGLQTRIIDSTTWEEAPITIKDWIKQRSRWIKGHMITTVIYLRSDLSSPLTWVPRSVFLMFLGLPIVVFVFTLPALLFSAWIFFQGREATEILTFCGWVFLVYNSISIGMHTLACTLAREYKLIPYTVILPLYWLLHGGASLISVVEYFLSPHSWAKTQHGVDPYRST